ncbi:MAG: Holliday junction branch migration protein RuvA [Polyangiaceae bacterium]|nr:Holliday junction branch migration protein RuvA [Polyangiaceae bacterium]
MIGLLTGRVIYEQPEGAVLLDVNGVGYELLVPVGTLGRAQRDGEKVVLSVHTHVREDALELYGFASERDRQLFRLVIGVPGVGPKTALNMLSALPPAELTRAIGSNDLGRLTRVPGIGKKTAERLALELRGRLPPLETQGDARKSAQPDNFGRVMTALTNMGYRPAEAERVLRAMSPDLDSRPVTELIREALSRLMP